MAEIDDLSITDASNTTRFPEGQAPSTVNDGMRALEGMLARAFSDTVDSNLRATLSSSVYEITTNRSISAYDGLVIAFRANAANAVGNVDLRINTHSAHDFQLPGGVEIPASYIAADQWVWAQFKGTASTWQMVSPIVMSAFALTLLNDASATAVRSTLGLGTAALVNTGVSNGNVPAMDATGYPAADGSQITALNATQLTSGTVPVARLSAASTTAVGVLETATTAENVTGTATDKIVTPGTQHYHPSACKCWGHVTVSAGVPTLQASYNVTSIADTGTGLMTVTIANDFADAYYAAVATIEDTASTVADALIIQSSKAAGSFVINSHRTDTAGAYDPQGYSWACFGTLA